MREKPGDDCVWYDDVAEEEQNCAARWTPGHPDATYAACARGQRRRRKQLFIDDGTARCGRPAPWGPIGGGMSRRLPSAILNGEGAIARNSRVD